jgi:hypothetical protein
VPFDVFLHFLLLLLAEILFFLPHFSHSSHHILHNRQALKIASSQE